MESSKRIKEAKESAHLLSPTHTSPPAYLTFFGPSTPLASSKELDIEAMPKSTNTHKRSKPMLLLGSAGLALLLLCLCAFSTNADAASVARSLIGLDKDGRLERRTVTSSYAYQRMLANIGGASSTAGGNQVPGVLTGSVIAAPSTDSPNYFYAWVRDAALTMKVAISQPTLDRTLVTNYANTAKVHQQNSSPRWHEGHTKLVYEVHQTSRTYGGAARPTAPLDTIIRSTSIHSAVFRGACHHDGGGGEEAHSP